MLHKTELEHQDEANCEKGCLFFFKFIEKKNDFSNQ
ncbi:MAG: hypothetical protein RL757_2987 [Bacteroidota bacterium]|jgi:hypothetical protein